MNEAKQILASRSVVVCLQGSPWSIAASVVPDFFVIVSKLYKVMSSKDFLYLIRCSLIHA